MPTDGDREAGERIVAMLREANGDVLVPWHGYLPRMAGKRGGAHLMALIDLETERSGRPEVWEALHAEFLESARTRDAALVLLDADLGEAKYRLGSLVYPGYAVEPKPLFSGDSERDMFQPVLDILEVRETLPAYILADIDDPCRNSCSHTVVEVVFALKSQFEY